MRSFTTVRALVEREKVNKRDTNQKKGREKTTYKHIYEHDLLPQPLLPRRRKKGERDVRERDSERLKTRESLPQAMLVMYYTMKMHESVKIEACRRVKHIVDIHT